MCGIAGIYSFKKPVDPTLLQQMTDILKYRGPDGQGFYIKENLGLGHCRLSIIDLSDHASQPMANEDETLWIVHNGEIYNFLELRTELKKNGHHFKSDTDTEVVLHAYEQWQEDCLGKFNGMWAFAIWDEKKRELFCSRDRFGIKPFYYNLNHDFFAFASEIKSLLLLGIPVKLNDHLVYDYLNFGMLDHTNDTFFKRIMKLPPASWLKIASDGSFIIKKYWNLSISDKIYSSRNNEGLDVEEFRHLFIDSVRLRLRSDVPVGTCLSGGLDSSSVVCVVNNLLKEERIPNIGERQKTFSSCFTEKSCDEREYIEEVIKYTTAEKNYIFPNSEGFREELDNLLWHQEEPFLNSNQYAQWSVMKLAKQKVKVLLDGQGGDELLGGYRKFYLFYLMKLLKNRQYLSFFREGISFFSSTEVLRTLNLKSAIRYIPAGQKMTGSLLSESFQNKYAERRLAFGYQDNLGERFAQDLFCWSLPSLLRYEDKNSMAHSLEARLPFLDYRLVEKVASLPLNQKMKDGWTKVILRKAMKGFLPPRILLRKSKLGFSTPEETWLKTNLSRDLYLAIKNSEFLQCYINKKKVLEKLEQFFSGKTIYPANLFFRFYIMELWARRFIQ